MENDLTQSLGDKLINACIKGDFNLVKNLISNGLISIHYRNDAALRNAALTSQLQIVKYLVFRGANIHALNDMALEQAYCFNNKKNYKILGRTYLKREEKEDMERSLEQQLCYVCMTGDLDLIEDLISKGVDNKIPSKYFTTSK